MTERLRGRITKWPNYWKTEFKAQNFQRSNDLNAEFEMEERLNCRMINWPNF